MNVEHLEESIYVACDCSEELFDTLVSTTQVLGTHNAFVMLEDDYNALDGGTKEILSGSVLYLEV